MELKSWGRFSR